MHIGIVIADADSAMKAAVGAVMEKEGDDMIAVLLVLLIAFTIKRVVDSIADGFGVSLEMVTDVVGVSSGDAAVDAVKPATAAPIEAVEKEWKIVKAILFGDSNRDDQVGFVVADTGAVAAINDLEFARPKALDLVRCTSSDALKLAYTTESRLLLFREKQILDKYNHPNILKVHPMKEKCIFSRREFGRVPV